jgi:muramoyltetrapeptide carboxypeptidase
MKDNTIPFGKTAEEIIAEHVAEYDYPVCFNFPADIFPTTALFLWENRQKLKLVHQQYFFQ